MLCIFTFVIFLILFPILGFFPEYRRLFARSWQCVFKKVTRQPCDINLGEELKNKLLGKFIFKYPKTIKFIDRTFTFWAFLFVVLNVWSLVSVSLSGLNLWVYDTCNPDTGESCSLSGEACGVSNNSISFTEAFETNRLLDYTLQPFSLLQATVSKIPNRLKTWQAQDYLSPKPTYLENFDSSKPTALEIIDPGCQYCRQLFRNIKATNFAQKYNLTFVLYPIPDSKNTFTGGYKFQSSKILARYIEATKYLKPETIASKLSPDWQLLDTIFTGQDNGKDYQELFNFTYSNSQMVLKIHEILETIGYTKNQIETLSQLANDQEVEQNLASQKDIAEKKVNTIRIPTIIFNRRRYDRVLNVDQLKQN